MKSFLEFNIAPKLADALQKLGYISPTEIQELVIPKALKGESVVAQSETGSGKTHAFIAPILEHLDLSKQETQALILSPTRELAKQIYDFFVPFKKFYPELKIKLIAGGVEKSKNIESARSRPQIVIATPGRLLDFINNGTIKLTGVKTLVLDETDMLLDLGFFPQVDSLISNVSHPQIMVFSATISKSVKSLLKKYINANTVITTSEGRTSRDVSHFLIDIKHQNLNDRVKEFIDILHPYLLIIFASKIETVDSIYAFLVENKYKVGIIHGNLDSRTRRSMMKRIRLDEFQIIVSSDIGARGIDIPNVSDVLSADLPNDLSYYFHRAGRSGRIGSKGSSYVFYNSDSSKSCLRLIEMGVKFSYLQMKDGEFVEGKPIEKTLSTRKKKNEELDRNIRIAVSKAKGTVVKPGYKKKVRDAVLKEKKKHHRKIIQKSIREQRVARYKEEAKNRYE